MDCQGRACVPAPRVDVLGGSVTYGVPSATCPPPVVSNAKHVDRGGFLPDPGQLTSPVGVVDGDGAPGGAPAARPATRSPPSTQSLASFGVAGEPRSAAAAISWENLRCRPFSP